MPVELYYGEEDLTVDGGVPECNSFGGSLPSLATARALREAAGLTDAHIWGYVDASTGRYLERSPAFEAALSGRNASLPGTPAWLWQQYRALTANQRPADFTITSGAGEPGRVSFQLPHPDDRELLRKMAQSYGQGGYFDGAHAVCAHALTVTVAAEGEQGHTTTLNDYLTSAGAFRAQKLAEWSHLLHSATASRNRPALGVVKSEALPLLVALRRLADTKPELGPITPDSYRFPPLLNRLAAELDRAAQAEPAPGGTAQALVATLDAAAAPTELGTSHCLAGCPGDHSRLEAALRNSGPYRSATDPLPELDWLRAAAACSCAVLRQALASTEIGWRPTRARGYKATEQTASLVTMTANPTPGGAPLCRSTALTGPDPEELLALAARLKLGPAGVVINRQREGLVLANSAAWELMADSPVGSPAWLLLRQRSELTPCPGETATPDGVAIRTETVDLAWDERGKGVRTEQLTLGYAGAAASILAAGDDYGRQGRAIWRLLETIQPQLDPAVYAGLHKRREELEKLLRGLRIEQLVSGAARPETRPGDVLATVSAWHAPLATMMAELATVAELLGREPGATHEPFCQEKLELTDRLVARHERQGLAAEFGAALKAGCRQHNLECDCRLLKGWRKLLTPLGNAS